MGAPHTDVGFHHYYNGRYCEAIAQLQPVLGMKSDFAFAHRWARAFVPEDRASRRVARGDGER